MAERLFTVDLNLGNNKAKNFRLEDFSNNPSSDLQSGRVIYFTGTGSDQNHFRVYNGTAWKTLAYTDDVPTIAINLDAPDLFSVSGSPANASGTLAFEWNTAAVNTVLAGPGTGSTAAIPTFRSLVDADIPIEIARVDDLNTALEDYIPLNEKGEPLGVAELNALGVVPAEQLDLSGYQPLDTDLTNIAALTGTAGILTTDGANGWSIDTNDYLVAADLPSTFVESLTNTDGNITFSTSTGAVTADLANDIDIAGSLTVQGDLTVNGDVTTLNTATMNVEDNIFVLNSNVTGTPVANAGLEVERGTYTNASVYWNEIANKWYLDTPVDTTDAAIASPIARKYVTTTTGTTHTITHNLNTSDVTVNCWLAGAQVEAAVVVTDANTVTVTTNSSITDLKTVVVG